MEPVAHRVLVGRTVVAAGSQGSASEFVPSRIGYFVPTGSCRSHAVLDRLDLMQ